MEQSRMQDIQSAYIRAFFDKHLKGIDSELLTGPSGVYPEVVIKIKN